MPLEEVIAGVTFQGFSTAPPTTPGLQALGIFGTGKDGKNTNRVSGGPAFVNLGAGPVFATSYMTVNTNSTTVQGLDTGVVETTVMQPGGWTMFAVARLSSGAAGNGTLMQIATGGSFGMVLNNANTIVSSHPSVWLGGSTTGGPVADSTLDLGAGNVCTNWKMYSCSFPGPAASPYTMRSVTDGLTKTTTATFSRTGNNLNHLNIGWQSTSGLTAHYLPIDVAASGVALGALALTDLNNLRTWLQGVLGVRGVTGF